MKKSLKLFLSLLMLCCMSVGNVWATGTTVTYAQTSASAASVSSGTAPKNSTVAFSNSYTNNKVQLTANNSMALTLSGYKGYKITGITLSMHSNKSAGAGTFSVVAGSTTLASISSNTNFSAWYNITAYTQDFTDVNVTMTNSSYEIKQNEDVTITISCSTKSLYCESFTITYEEAGGNTPSTNPTVFCEPVFGPFWPFWTNLAPPRNRSPLTLISFSVS